MPTSPPTATKAYEKVQPIAGAEQAMKDLAAMNLILATTTGFDGPLTKAILSRLGWQHYFAASITSDDVTRRPARALYAVSRHGSRPRQRDRQW